ncbi:MAG TPA: DnaJ C-terminal domain-containing protein [Phycisphaerae bacterium]|nr:DnaJ C-terminal domain-containing protein [Phycisphaerae bacterium]
MRDCYEVLGISRNATDDQIKSAYRKLARKYHPDVNKAPDAEKKFREATQAYDILSDKEKRKLFDQFGTAAFEQGGGPRPGQGAPGGAGVYGGWRPGGAGGSQRVQHVNFEDIFGGGGGGMGGGSSFMGMGLDEILEALGGGAASAARRSSSRRRSPAPPQRGADVEHDIHLDFLQAIRGTQTHVRMSVTDPQTGKTDVQTISVKIPAGVKEGQKVRLRGKGQEGPAGAGDLLLVCHVNPHKYFRREGDDIYIDLPVGITEAALGATIDVPTIDGMTTVKIPAGISGGQKLRLRGRGVETKNGRGDQYVVIKIAPPKKLTDEQKKLLEKFRDISDDNPRKDIVW